MDSLLLEKDSNEISDTSIFSLFNKNRIQRFDGSVNVWLNKKDIAIFKDNIHDWDAVDILKYSPGYCIVTRSKLFKHVPLNFCCSLSGMKINSSNIYLYSVGDIILCKMSNWKTYIPCTIKDFHDKVECGQEEKYHGNFADACVFGDATLSLFFSSCPESDVTLAWHYGNKIIPNCSVVSYKEILNNMTNTRDDNIPFVNELYKSNKNKIFYNTDNKNSNIMENENTIYVEDDIDSSSEEESDGQPYRCEIKKIVSGLVDKVCVSSEKYENLKYRVCWVKNVFNGKNIFNNKGITVASTEFAENLRRDFLPNVRILEDCQMKHIFKLQQKNGNFLKIIPKQISPRSEKFCNIEPQTLEQFKGDCNFRNIAHFLHYDYYVTYTGSLCYSAKKYLFNL